VSTDGTTGAPHAVLVVGDGEVARALSSVSQTLGWEPLVVDTLADALAALPRCESVVVLSHHDGVDGPALAAALQHGGASYIGAMGSRRTQARRRAWMLDNGTPEDAVDSIRGPAGLDIGADTPGEIALSITAEIVAVRRRGAVGSLGGSLSERPGPIHPDLPPGTAECPAG
jgi:xanthine/CO dehydrogenase XdhC/CoxF family maturation factor